MTEKNRFTATGRVISIRQRGKEKILTLIIKNKSQDIYPQIHCQNQPMDWIKDHEYVTVTGHAESRISETTQASYPVLCADRIEKAIPEIEKEFHTGGRFVMPKQIYLYVSGIVQKIREDNGYVRYTVETSSPDGTAEEIRIDWKKIERHPDYPIGSHVCAVCAISTPQKQIGTEKRIFLNFNVFDMGILEQ